MHKPHHQVDQYRKNSVNGASPLQLIVMLYDGALKQLEAARRAMASKDVFRQNECLQKAQKILAELMSCLDMERGDEIARNLFALYSFCYNRLVETNLTDDTSGIDEVKVVLNNLRAGWVELDQQIRTGAHQTHAAA